MSKGQSIEHGLSELLAKTNIEKILSGGHNPDEFGSRFSQGEGGNRRVAGHRDADGTTLKELVIVEVVPSIGGTEVRIDPRVPEITDKRRTGYAKQPRNIEISENDALALAKRVLGFLGSVVDQREPEPNQ